MQVHIVLGAVFFTEVFVQDTWTLLDSLQDSQLNRLTTALPQRVLSSKADSTAKRYMYAFLRRKEWAESKTEVKVFPVM